MLLYHLTERRCMSSIRRFGLDPRCSRGSRQVVWLCSRSRIVWAVNHVSAHHGTRPESMVLVPVRVPRAWLLRTNRPGIWQCNRQIPPARLGGAVCR